MSKEDLLRQAIRKKQQVTAQYQGRPREFCPHILGTKNGRLYCLVYQFGGESSGQLTPGSPDNWRCLKVDELSAVSVSDGDWHTCAPRAGKEQRCVEFIEVEVE